MREVLNRLSTGSIVGILTQAWPAIQCPGHGGNQEPVIKHCDLPASGTGSFQGFCSRSKCDGAIPAYKGFTPLIGETNYVYENGLWPDIQKQPFTIE